MAHTNPLPPVYLINRACDSERLSHALHQLRLVGLSKNVTRIEALNGCDAYNMRHKLSTRNLSEYIQRFRSEAHTSLDYRIPMSWAHVAHAASHGEAWSVIQSQNQPVIVFEDSFVLVDKEAFLFAMHQALQCVGEHCGDTHPAMCMIGSECTQFRIFKGNVVRVDSGLHGTMCYVINPSAATALLHVCFPMTYAIPTNISRASSFDLRYHVSLLLIDFEDAGIDRSDRFLPSVHAVINDDTSARYLQRVYKRLKLDIARRIVSFLPSLSEICVRCELPYDMCNCT